MYLDAVEYGIADTIMNNKTIPNGTYIIMENGNICIGTYSNKTCTGDVIEVEVNGETPKEGSTVIIEEDKIKGINLLYGDKTIIKDNNGSILYKEVLAPGAYYTDGTFKDWQTLIDEEYIYDNMIAPINLFEGDTTLVTMVFDDSFTRFGVVGAFSNCTNLTKVIIPNSIDSIAPYTFKNTNLTSIAIPNSVTVIDSEAFDGCTNLTTIYYSGTAEDINANNWGATNATLKPYSEAPSELLP